MSDFILWVIYDHPIDFPDYYIARKWDYQKNIPTDEIMKSTSLKWMQDHFSKMGFCRIPRDNSDDLKIIESWI
jgi:hypothetical protein